jgi:hypothetical protein
MTPPRVCPQPPDCPLYEQRLAYGQDEPLRRAVLMERRRMPDLTALIRTEAASSACRPIAALPPAPEPSSLSILDYLKESKRP